MRDRFLDLAQIACDLLMNCRPHSEGVYQRGPKIVAHRGAWDRRTHIENTMLAFLKAKELGADAIELDVHFTADNVAVVHHDPALNRLFQKEARIEDLSFGELRMLVPQIPSLSEVLSIEDLHFFIEVKTSLSVEQVGILEGLLSGFEVVRDFHFLVLDPELVRLTSKFHAHAWILVGELSLAKLVDISIERGLGGVAGHYLGMTNALIAKLHSAGQIAGSGFIPTKNLYRREWKRGIEFVFTNSTYRLF